MGIGKGNGREREREREGKGKGKGRVGKGWEGGEFGADHSKVHAGLAVSGKVSYIFVGFSSGV